MSKDSMSPSPDSDRSSYPVRDGACAVVFFLAVAGVAAWKGPETLRAFDAFLDECTRELALLHRIGDPLP